MDTDTFLTHEKAASLLRPPGLPIFASAEDRRPWARQWTPALKDIFPGSVLADLWDSLLLRTFDPMSGSQPDEQGRMLARSPRLRLDTDETRVETLSNHANHKTWKDTPFISFTNCSQSLQELADWRATRNRGDQQIVVVDPRVRFELHLPILKYSEEMTHYSIKSPYTGDYWGNHYLCLWEVTPEEVVGVWYWEELRHRPNWYDEVIIPAVNQYRENRNVDQPEQCSRRPQPNVAWDVSDASDDNDNGLYLSDSDDSYERVCEENWTGELMKMYEDLRLD